MPSGKPTKNPTTGMTKKPTPASTNPTTIERRGTPALRSWRPGTSNLTTWAPPITTDTTASTDQAVAEPTANAHTAIAAQTSSAPGQHRHDDAHDADRDREAHEQDPDVAHRGTG